MTENDKKIFKREEPARWRPVDIEKFNKYTKEVARVFKSDSERVGEAQRHDCNED